MSSKRQQDKLQQTVRDLVHKGANKTCFVCKQKEITQQLSCSRKFNHRAKGIAVSNFSEEEVKRLVEGGNELAERTYLAKWSAEQLPRPKPRDDKAIEYFISETFEKKRWYSETPVEKGEAEETQHISKLMGKEKLPKLEVKKEKRSNSHSRVELPQQQKQQQPPAKQQQAQEDILFSFDSPQKAANSSEELFAFGTPEQKQKQPQGEQTQQSVEDFWSDQPPQQDQQQPRARAQSGMQMASTLFSGVQGGFGFGGGQYGNAQYGGGQYGGAGGQYGGQFAQQQPQQQYMQPNYSYPQQGMYQPQPNQGGFVQGSQQQYPQMQSGGYVQPYPQFQQPSGGMYGNMMYAAPPGSAPMSTPMSAPMPAPMQGPMAGQMGNPMSNPMSNTPAMTPSSNPPVSTSPSKAKKEEEKPDPFSNLLSMTSTKKKTTSSSTSQPPSQPKQQPQKPNQNSNDPFGFGDMSSALPTGSSSNKPSQSTTSSNPFGDGDLFGGSGMSNQGGNTQSGGGFGGFGGTSSGFGMQQHQGGFNFGGAPNQQQATFGFPQQQQQNQPPQQQSTNPFDF